MFIKKIQPVLLAVCLMLQPASVHADLTDILKKPFDSLLASKDTSQAEPSASETESVLLADSVVDVVESVMESNVESVSSEPVLEEPDDTSEVLNESAAVLEESDTVSEAEFIEEEEKSNEQLALERIQSQYDVRKSIIRIVTGYEFDDGSFDEWTSGYGFLLTKDTAVVNRTAAVIDQDSQLYRQIRAERYDSYKTVLGVDLSDYASVAKNLHTYIVNGKELVEATVNSKAYGDSFAVLSLSERINSKETVILSEESLKEATTVYAIGTETKKESPEKLDFFGRRSNITGVRKNGTSEYVEFSGSFGMLSAGCPLINQEQVVVGMITDGGNGKGSAVDIKTITAALDAANIEYTSEGQKDTSRSEIIAKIESLVSEAGAVDRSLYTEESLQIMDDAVSSANALILDDTISKNRLEKQIAPLEESIAGLQKIDHSGTYIRIGVFIGILVFAVIAFFVIRQMLRDRGKEDWQLQEEREERKAAFKEKLSTKSKEIKEKKTKEQKKEKKRVEVEDDDPETGVLDADEETGLLRDDSCLVNTVTGARIPISKPEIIIGKASKGVDYRIQNDTVSRKHCKILKRGNEYYIEDLDSRNGTYIDGKRLEPHDPMPLFDGQTVLLSNEKYVFEEKQ